MTIHAMGVGLVLGALATVAPSTSMASATTRQPRSSATVVSRSKARRIAAVWGGTLTFLPTWAPPDVVPSHWWSETCACGTDDNRLVVRFKHQQTRLDWEVSDQQEIHRVRAGIVCR